MKPLALLALLALVPMGASAQIVGTDLDCSTSDSSTSTGHIAWPTADAPIWEFDFIRPAQAAQPNGMGLELLNLKYEGRLVMRRASLPLITTEYDAGGCGCLRDRTRIEAGFQADGVLSGNTCLANSTPGVVRTTCERNLEPACDISDPNDPDCGGDVGSFRGVAFEDYGEELVLTTHMLDGWYRFRMRWHLYADGRIWPELSFSASDDGPVCAENSHRHHGFWRFDFDLGDSGADDVVREKDSAGNETLFTTEVDRVWGASDSGVYWTVVDGPTGLGYTIEPSESDLLLPPDTYSKTDALVLKYDPAEFDIGVDATIGRCNVDYSQEQDGESIVGEDIVFWYRSGAFHLGGNPWECDIQGPMLRPFDIAVGGDAPSDGGRLRLDTSGPNPFTPYTTVRFRLPEAAYAELVLLDALGREVRQLFVGEAAGERDETVRIPGFGLPAGTYTVRLSSGGQQTSRRIVLVK